MPKENGLGLGMRKFLRVIFHIIKFILKTLGIFFVAFLIWWLVIIPITNNVILNGYVKELKQYAMDSKFEIVEDIKACGKLYGNGNGMEYMVMLRVRSDEELEETDMFTTGSWEGIWVIRADNDKRLSGLLDEYNRYRTEDMLAALAVPESLEGYYILFSSHSAEWDSFLKWDLRAH